jgi:hypothetical protein
VPVGTAVDRVHEPVHRLEPDRPAVERLVQETRLAGASPWWPISTSSQPSPFTSATAIV